MAWSCQALQIRVRSLISDLQYMALYVCDKYSVVCCIASLIHAPTMSLAVMSPLFIQPIGRCASYRMLRYRIEGVQVKVTVAQDDAGADLALRQLYNPPCGPIVTGDQLVLSIDAEWTPVPHEAPSDQKPDVIQVCDGHRVVIIQCALVTRKWRV